MQASNEYKWPFRARHIRRVACIGSNLRASNEALLRARVPRAQEPTRPPPFFLQQSLSDAKSSALRRSMT